MIVIENVSLSHRDTPILRDIDLSLPRGGITALVGPNGAGKSSLFSLIARLQPLQKGRIIVDGMPVDTTPSRTLAQRLAILRQDGAVANRLTVREIVGFGRFPHHRGRPAAEDHVLVDAALSEFDLHPLADRFIDALSGGQRQRAMVAMTFCQGTDYLLLDEPLNNLDMFHARQLMRCLRTIADERQRTAIIVLHDINQAASYADRIVALRDGRVIADGTPDDVLTEDHLESIFGYRMKVGHMNGKPFVLHHL
ncbi:putative iron(III) ABC transporter, ATP-binding protein [Sinorhizobium fredii HH103]|uniref:Iron(III) ABC transporter, ATP-binding protein n=1 Tax=Sinorhizobium fredii (strain HH103) TaxID=1117943 RepID=G9A5Z4_SINF1|nr:ATP-binding cassette domain-containing protein [Sinorhizobium fredii]CCE95822.1 putative iron(III) ABC transporter, ATP-binding protein [Sinorhizobium fredii HH103]